MGGSIATSLYFW